MGRNGYIYEARNGDSVYTGTSRELAEIFGVSREKVTGAYSQGYRLNGYDLVKLRDVLSDGNKTEITPKMWQDWDDECMKFRRAYAQRRKNGK